MSIQTTPTGLLGPAGIVALALCGIGVPEQVGVVVEGWISQHRRDDPIPKGGSAGVLAAARDRGVKDNLAVPVIHRRQDRCPLRDNDVEHPGPGRPRFAVPAGAYHRCAICSCGTRSVRRRVFGAQHVGDPDVLPRGEAGVRGSDA